MLQEFENSLDNIIDHFGSNMRSLTIERITPSILWDLKIKTAKGISSLKAISDIVILEPRKLEIKPHSKDNISYIESAFKTYIMDHSLELQKDRLVCSFPDITAESRLKMLKYIGQITEQVRVNLRIVRQKTIDELKKTKLSENKEKSQIQEIENLFQKKNELVKELQKNKEKQIKGK